VTSCVFNCFSKCSMVMVAASELLELVREFWRCPWSGIKGGGETRDVTEYWNCTILIIVSFHFLLSLITAPLRTFHSPGASRILCGLLQSQWRIWIYYLRPKYLKLSHLHATLSADEVHCTLSWFYLPPTHKGYVLKEGQPTINKWVLEYHLDTFENNGVTEANPAEGNKLRNTDSPYSLEFQVNICFSLL